MTPVPRAVKVRHEKTGNKSLLTLTLKNIGSGALPPGAILAKQINRDGTLELLSFRSSAPLQPGETAHLRQWSLDRDALRIELKNYDCYRDKIAMNQSVKPGWFGWKLG